MVCVHRSEGLSLREAYKVVLESRQFIRPNAGFWHQLIQDERSLFNRTTVRMVRTSAGILPELQDDTEMATCVNV